MIIMAISAVFETTKERLEFIFKRKLLNKMVDTKLYFLGMHPSIDVDMPRVDVISGCIKFLEESLELSSIKTNNFNIDIDNNSCIIECITGAYTFPKIIITNFRSQSILINFKKDKDYDSNIFPEKFICNYTMIALAEALSKYYLQVYDGRREIKV
jgi:hypothetical protein